MPSEMREQLLMAPQNKFNVSQLIRSGPLSYSKEGRQSFIHRDPHQDPRPKLSSPYVPPSFTKDVQGKTTILPPENKNAYYQ